jgi:hypothetical protein
MPIYLIEFYLPRSRQAELRAAAVRVRRAADELADEGMSVRYLRSAFLPYDELAVHLLEASSAGTVGIASKRAGVAPERVIEAVPVHAGRRNREEQS